MGAPPTPQAVNLAAAPEPGAMGAKPLTPPRRDRIVVIGRRRAGKTIYLARLYEALWQGCKLVDGKAAVAGESTEGRRVVEVSCRATSGAAHTQFMKVIQELRAGRWPAATIGNSYAELIVTYGGRERVLTALDYPGEVFRKAFMNDSDDPDAVELLAAIDRAAAAIFLIDPAVVAAGGEESYEDTFGLTQAASRIRSGRDGTDVPIAVVFTKADVNRALLREAGGVREFAFKHFGQMFRSVERTSVFPTAAVRVAENGLGRSVPRADKPAENVVEPLRYCFEMMDSGDAKARIREAQQLQAEAEAVALDNEVGEKRRTTNAWVIFIIAVIALFAVVGLATWSAVSK
jgi:hypothetical protein